MQFLEVIARAAALAASATAGLFRSICKAGGTPAPPAGHAAAGGGWWNPFPGGKTHGRSGRKSPSNNWIRVPQQTLIPHPPDHQVTQDDIPAIQDGKALYFTGKVLAKVDVICRHMGRSEILWYFTARRSNPWVIDDLLLPDDQYATSGTCYASADEVLAVSRQARRKGRIIVGAGHSHGHLGVFSSLTDLDLMGQLNAERVGFASQVQQQLRGRVAKQTQPPPADRPEGSPLPASVFEVTFEENPQAWLAITARGELSDDDLTVKLHLLQRQQSSFFTTHNADGERYFPVHHVTSCLHCGTRLEDFSSEDVAVHVIGPEELSEEEENDLIAELEQKAPRSGFFRERWGWKPARMHQKRSDTEPSEEEDEQHHEDQAGKPADFFVYRRGERVGTVSAAVLEEAAYRCPALAKALGWDDRELADDEPPEPERREATTVQAAEELAEQMGPASSPEPERQPPCDRSHALTVRDDPPATPQAQTLDDLADRLVYEMDHDRPAEGATRASPAGEDQSDRPARPDASQLDPPGDAR